MLAVVLAVEANISVWVKIVSLGHGKSSLHDEIRTINENFADESGVYSEKESRSPRAGIFVPP